MTSASDQRQTYERLDMILAAMFAAFGYALASWKLAALSWDGSWYLFSSLQRGTPFIAHGRYGTYPILWLLVQVSGWLHSSVLVSMLYGGLLALFPLGSLAMSWWILRGETYRHLRIWPLLGILLGALPGQLCLMSEATLVAQLFWPIFALVLTGPRTRPRGAILLGLSILAALLHPTSVLIFGLASVLFGWRAWRVDEHRKNDRVWSVVFALLALGKFVETSIYATGYERNQVSWQMVHWQWSNSVWGYPLVFLGLAALLGLLVLLPDWVPKGWAHALLCLAMTATGLYWASDVVHWSGLLDYRRFVLPAMLPWLVLGAWHRHRLAAPSELARRLPPFALSSVAAVFCLVFTTQILVWGGLVERLAGELSRRGAQERFVSAEELPFTQGTPLRHWSATPMSILLQGQQPRAIYVLRRKYVLPHSVYLYNPDDLSLSDGWFALSPLVVGSSTSR